MQTNEQQQAVQADRGVFDFCAELDRACITSYVRRCAEFRRLFEATGHRTARQMQRSAERALIREAKRLITRLGGAA